MKKLLQRIGSKFSKKTEYNDFDGELNLERRYNQNNVITAKQLEQILKEMRQDLKYISLRSLLVIQGNQKLQWPFVVIIVNKEYQKLQTLCMDGNHLGVKGCKFFSKGEWPSLVNLQLDGNQIQKPGLSHLVKTHLPQIELISINLEENFISDDGVPLILGNPWKKLRILYFQGNESTVFGCYRFLTTHVPKKLKVYGFERVYLSDKNLEKQINRMKLLLKQAYPSLLFHDFG